MVSSQAAKSPPKSNPSCECRADSNFYFFFLHFPMSRHFFFRGFFFRPPESPQTPLAWHPPRGPNPRGPERAAFGANRRRGRKAGARRLGRPGGGKKIGKKITTKKTWQASCADSGEEQNVGSIMCRPENRLCTPIIDVIEFFFGGRPYDQIVVIIFVLQQIYLFFVFLC